MFTYLVGDITIEGAWLLFCLQITPHMAQGVFYFTNIDKENSNVMMDHVIDSFG